MDSKLPNPVRLACIRPAASVHPEPGSNSPLYNVFVCIQTLLLKIEICICASRLALGVLTPRSARFALYLYTVLPRFYLTCFKNSD